MSRLCPPRAVRRRGIRPRGAPAFSRRRPAAHRGPFPHGRGAALRALALLLALASLCLPARPAAALEPSAAPASAASEPDAAGDPLAGLDGLAGSYLLMDAATGQVLAAREPDAAHYPASLAKVMTLALVLEQYGEDRSALLTASESALEAVGPGSSSIYLRAGETMTLEDALWAAQLESANDAANLLAEAAGGSIAAFVERMNARAAGLGLQTTRFVNPSGYHDDAQVTTAREFARIVRWALTVPGFSGLLGGIRHTMPGNPVHPAPRQLETDNRLLVSEPYPGLLGGKTGWTDPAGFTMLQVAARGGHTLIAVALACPRRTDSYTVCTTLLDHGFGDFVPARITTGDLALPALPVLRAGERLGTVPLELEAEAELLLPAGLTAGQLRCVYLGPNEYTEGTPFQAAAALCGPAGETLAELPLVPSPAALEALGAGEEADPWDPRGLRPILPLCLAVLLGAALSSRGALRLAEQRRRSARRRLRRLCEQGRARAARLDEPDEPLPEDGPPGPEPP